MDKLSVVCRVFIYSAVFKGKYLIYHCRNKVNGTTSYKLTI